MKPSDRCLSKKNVDGEGSSAEMEETVKILTYDEVAHEAIRKAEIDEMRGKNK